MSSPSKPEIRTTKHERGKPIAMAIDNNKATQMALVWAVKNLLTKDETFKLVHIRDYILTSSRNDSLAYTQDMFLPYRCYCLRKEISCENFVLEEENVSKGLVKFIFQERIETLVLGSGQRKSISKVFRGTCTISDVLKNAPNFCTIYVISPKGKVQSVKNATQKLISPLSPTRDIKEFDELSALEMENSSTGRQSTESNFQSFYQSFEKKITKESPKEASTLNDYNNHPKPSSISSLITEKYDEKVENLKKELKETLDVYHQALNQANQKVIKEKEEIQNTMKEEIKMLKEREKAALEALGKSNLFLHFHLFFLLLLFFYIFFFNV